MARQALLWGARIAVAIGLLALVAWLGHFPIGSAKERGVLRLAWRMSGAQVRVCRERSEEELQRLLLHMRQRLACEDHVVPYRLALSVDGAPRLERQVLPRGAKGDRPIYVEEELPLAPGEHEVAVEFAPAPLATPPPAEAEERQDEEQERREQRAEGHETEAELLRQAIAKAPRYRLERTLRTASGRITLIELDESARELKVHGP